MKWKKNVSNTISNHEQCVTALRDTKCELCENWTERDT